MNILSKQSILLSFLMLLSSFCYGNDNVKLLAPQQVIDSTSQRLLIALKSSDFSEDKVKVREFVNKEIFPQVDIVRMSALVLGKHWRKASHIQKSRFIIAFKALLVNTYASTFTEQFNDWTIEYFPLKLKVNAKKTLVKTKVHQPGKASAKIDYSMVLRNDEWKIFDIKVEGISLVISNRSTFSQMIQQSGNLETVIKELEDKVSHVSLTTMGGT